MSLIGGGGVQRQWKLVNKYVSFRTAAPILRDVTMYPGILYEINTATKIHAVYVYCLTRV